MLSATKCVPPAVLIAGLNWPGSADAAITRVPPCFGEAVDAAAAAGVAWGTAVGAAGAGGEVGFAATAVGTTVGAAGTAEGPQATMPHITVMSSGINRRMTTWLTSQLLPARVRT